VSSCACHAVPQMGGNTVVWFRKGLRLHDNPALLAALDGATAVMPLFILDPHFLKPQNVGGARMRFLLESLSDLDASLRARSSRLIVLHGAPPARLSEARRGGGGGRSAMAQRVWPSHVSLLGQANRRRCFPGR
jgi:DNA photolyase